jgi:hypothetical protein
MGTVAQSDSPASQRRFPGWALSAEAAVISWLEALMNWLAWGLLAGDVLLVGALWFYEFGREVFELDDSADRG